MYRRRALSLFGATGSLQSCKDEVDAYNNIIDHGDEPAYATADLPMTGSLMLEHSASTTSPSACRPSPWPAPTRCAWPTPPIPSAAWRRFTSATTPETSSPQACPSTCALTPQAASDTPTSRKATPKSSPPSHGKPTSRTRSKTAPSTRTCATPAT